MGLIVRFARTALGMLAVACGAAIALAPSSAQAIQSSLTLGGRTFALAPIELDRLTDLARVVHTINRVNQDRALAAARNVANSSDARYVLAIYQLEIGRQRQDDALRAPALDVLIADPQTQGDKLPGYLGVRGSIAFRSGDYPMAASLWGRLAELQPNDPQALNNLAQVRAAQGDSQGAVDLIRRAIAAHRTGPPPEIWYRQWLAIAFNGRLVEQGAVAARALITAYPTPANWRDALVAYRELAAPRDAAEIDLLRLMRAAGALIRPPEYQRLAQLLLHAGFAVEAKAVLDEGIARGVVNRAEAPTPAIIAEIDRAIARPPARVGPAAATLNRADSTSAAARLAEAVTFFRAGRRPEAEAAFRALAGQAGGQSAARWYPDLASFWLIWLAQSG